MEVVIITEVHSLTALLNSLTGSQHRNNQTVVLIGGRTEEEKWSCVFASLFGLGKKVGVYVDSVDVFKNNCRMNIRNRKNSDPFLTNFKKTCSVEVLNDRRYPSSDREICVFFPGTHDRTNDAHLSSYISSVKKKCPVGSVILVIPTNVQDVSTFESELVDHTFYVS
jgi:hypothetical protein